MTGLRRFDDEQGMAVVLVMVASMLLLALGGSLVLGTATETAIASSYRDGVAALYAAEAGAGVAMARLTTEPRWAPTDGPYLADRLDRLLGVDGGAAVAVSVSLADAGAADRIAIVSQATGGGAQRAVRVTVTRAVDADGRPALRVVAWEEVR